MTAKQKQIRNKLEAQSETRPGTNRKQTENKPFFLSMLAYNEPS
jgi:hypothetical protein